MAGGGLEETEALGKREAVEFVQPLGQVLVEGPGHALGCGEVQEAGSGLANDATQRGRAVAE
ncbi:hypothetical protein SAZ_33960 [Streptomyces noursei ZPM]|nr:hypothetical protein SAZ_33960 [Streptomyces noursei ZPM]EOT04858.1 hypothetical protein K530_06372 [Streptomyces noursei CCRC 11814]EXU87884.1 hypothetical protein P354_33120 [Streptomyces noursei PD-1]